MSEQGWWEFLGAEGVDDWVVLHGGATAVFRVGSVGEAARLAEALARVPNLEGSGVLMTIADSLITVRLTRDLWKLEPEHAELARAVATVAREHGAVADRGSVQEVQLAIASTPDAIDVAFWRAVLGYAAMADDNAVDPLGHGSTVWMQTWTRPGRCGMRCTSTCRSRGSTSRRGSRQQWRRVAASSTNRRTPGTGRSPIAPATAYASPHGRTGGKVRLRTSENADLPPHGGVWQQNRPFDGRVIVG